MRKFFSLIAAVLFAGGMMADNFVLVTDASTLAAGDQIIITDVDAAAAISTTQNNNNRGVAEVTLEDGIIVPGENVQIITLVAAEANFMLQVGEDAYLYAASNSSNHLKTSTATTVGDNGKFAISIASGVASVTAQGTNSRNDLRYNPSGMFSCYGSTSSIEAGLKIFKKDGGVTPPAVATPVIAGDETFEESVEVSIACATEGAAILYTTDDAAELNAFVAYTAALSLTESATVRAYAVLGEDTSAVVSKTFTKEEPAVLVQYEVAEAIAAGLTDGTEIEVRGIITKMEMKGKNFAKYGSVNVYVADATGAAGEFEFYNCYSMNADTFKVTVPAYDAASSTITEVTEVSDANGYAIHVGDTVIAHGNYKLYGSTHELNTGCYIVYAKVPGADFPTAIENAAAEQKAVKVVRNGQLFIEKNGVLYNAQGTIVR